jgi:large conductance mechanosensitive channel
MLKEFREFISQGDVMSLAVAVIIGGAFSAIVGSLVGDIIMPLLGIVLGGLDFSTLAAQVGSATVAYGKFIQAIVNFLVIAFVIFLLVRSVNRAKKPAAPPAPPAPAEPAAEEKLLTEIRDLLKNK